MVSDINFLLVGNSRLHWAKYSKNQSKFFHTKKEQKVPENIDPVSYTHLTLPTTHDV